jgi:hypothetical protein
VRLGGTSEREDQLSTDLCTATVETAGNASIYLGFSRPMHFADSAFRLTGFHPTDYETCQDESAPGGSAKCGGCDSDDCLPPPSPCNAIPVARPKSAAGHVAN